MVPSLDPKREEGRGGRSVLTNDKETFSWSVSGAVSGSRHGGLVAQLEVRLPDWPARGSGSHLCAAPVERRTGRTVGGRCEATAGHWSQTVWPVGTGWGGGNAQDAPPRAAGLDPARAGPVAGRVA